jgi:pseudouridine synthase
LTNDGPWAEKVLHPRFGVEREYAVGLRSPLDPDQRGVLEAGIALDEGTATLFHLRSMTEVEIDKLVGLLDPPPGELAWYRATLRQGWKRQLRRMFAAVGTPIERLVRVRIGPVRIDGLRTGRTRSLKAPEVRGLGSGAGRSRDEGVAPRPRSAVPPNRGRRPRPVRPGGEGPAS